MNYKGAIKYLAAVALIIVIGIFLYKQDAFKQLSNVSLEGYLFTILLLFFAYLLGGIQISYLLHRETKIALTAGDIALLPCSINMFGYIIPTNGGMLYSVLFLKAKYRIDFVKTLSVGFGMVFISVMLNGLIGLFFCYIAKLRIEFFIASLLFLFSPFFAFAVGKLLSVLNFKKDTWLFRLRNFVQEALSQSVALITQGHVFFTITFTSLIIILLNIGVYYWINVMLGTGLSFAATSLTIVLLNISSLIRIVPGNLGVEELIASGIFSLTGSDPMTGALVTLFLRTVNLSLTIPLGILHTAINYQKIAEPLLQLRKGKKIV
ncbi:MAG: lysylphosphatidylglycerol synthase domain-containing protein [Chitinophagales bacterium]|mgnify:CR=1 FL=1|nr:lysylphosphatidylglycerol synthase domain-containing protein [Chitinophagales bacterium]